MPLPTTDQPWPPPTLQALFDDIRLADTWYSGTATDLAEYHTRMPARQRRGFWGRNRSGEQVKVEKRIHLPTAAAIAQTSADLLFGETPGLTSENDAANDRLTELVEDGGIGATLLEGAELASGLGGVYLRPVWDRSVTDRPMLTVMDPDSAVPEFRWGQLWAVTFWSEIDRTEQTVVRHLERYEAGVILHGVYIGTPSNLGHRADLLGFAQTKTLEAAKTDGVDDLTAFGVEGVASAYVPNVKPNRRRRKHPVGRHMGRADTAGCESLMSSIDEAWSSLMRDIELGKRRIIVPDEFLTKGGRGQGSTFDTDQPVFSGLDIDPRNAEKAGITMVDFAIRASDHLTTATELFAQLTAQCGYSTSSLGQGDDGPQKTATEVDSEDSLSDRTTAKKRRYWGRAIADVAEVMLKVDRAVFGSQVEPVRPKVEWPTADENPEALARRLNLLSVSKSASVEQRVRMQHGDWDEKKIADEVDAIKAENSTQVADPFEGVA